MQMTTAEILWAPYSTVTSTNLLGEIRRLLQLGGELETQTSVTAWRVTRTGTTLLGLEALGKDIWAGIDADKYVSELRDEWPAT